MPDKKIIILVSLSIVALASLVWGVVASGIIKSGRPKAAVVASEVRPGAQDSAADFSIPDFKFKPRPKSAFNSWGRNPFSLHNKADRDFTLSGIFRDRDKPTAIINNKIVAIGDKIEGFNVTAIRENSVVVNDGKADFELRLGED